MNRFQRGNGQLLTKENQIKCQAGVRLYDGDQTTNFDKGLLVLTNFRLLWRNQLQHGEELSLQLQLVVLAEEESGGWNRRCENQLLNVKQGVYRSNKEIRDLSRNGIIGQEFFKILVPLSYIAKIKLHVNSLPSNELATGPITFSPFNFVKLSFREGGQSEFLASLKEVLSNKEWKLDSSSSLSGPKFRPGIAGIERAIQAKNEQADRSIVTAFEDLKRLMEMAKDMVSIARSVSQKIRDKQGNISEDETVTFKSQLLSLGISDPVTKDSCDSSLSYYRELSKQLALILEKPVQESGGMLSLTDIYCRVNRARGLELLSPDDLLNGCKMFESLGLPLRLQIFDSGVKVVQLAAHNNVRAAMQIKEMLSEKGTLSADELAFHLGTSLVLAKERLLYAEKGGFACRDDSVEGMCFYPNRFLTEES